MSFPPFHNNLSRPLIDAELERIAASNPFRRSARHTRFLRHLIAMKLAGETGRLREIALGVDVFHRSPTRFDPRVDTIVRVEARRLRQKLARYYAQEGHDARLEFVLPVGAYEIEIRRRNGIEAPARPRASVAIFDVATATADAAVNALAANLSFDLTGALTRLNGLRVVAPGAAPSPSTGPALRERVKGLNVTNVVLGELAAEDGALLLALRLVRIEDQTLMWSRRIKIERESASEHLELLARAIIAELHREAARNQLQRLRLAGSEPIVRSHVNGEVRERLGLARICMRQNTLDGCRKAEALAEEAIALAPDHAPSYVLLAQALIASVGMTALPSQPSMESARLAARRAVDLDGEIADAHGELGTIQFCFDRDWPMAEASMLRALRFAPAQATSHARYGWALMMNRRFDEARVEYHEALELDPLSLLYRTHQALIDLYAHDFDAARRGLDRVLEVAPDHLIALALRAALYLYAGAATQARNAYLGIAERFPKFSIGHCGLGQAYALLGDEIAAHRELGWLRNTFEAGYVSPYQLAMVHARLGELDAAIDWLARSAQLRDFNFVCVAVDPAFDALHATPRFQQVLASNGLGHLAAVTPDRG